MRRRGLLTLFGLPLAAAATLLFSAVPAWAATPGPGWSINSAAEPTNFSAGETQDRYLLTVTNVGSRSAEGGIAIVDKLPAGLVAAKMMVEETVSHRSGSCSVAEVRCEYGKPLAPGHQLRVELYVAAPASPAAGTLINEATVSGGGREASTSESTPLNGGAALFGIAGLAFEAVGIDGASDLQAGGHPFGVTTTIDLNTKLVGGISVYDVAQDARDVSVELPPGFVGDPLATERCPEVDLTAFEGSSGGGRVHAGCPAGTQVGTVYLVWAGGESSERYPLYNVVPEAGYPAELGFNAGMGEPIFLYASVMPSAAGYRLRMATPGALRTNDVEAISVTVFGDPAERDGRGGSAAFLTNPTDCSGGPLSVGAEATSWEGVSASAEATAYPAVVGCGLLQGAAAFDPGIAVEPETTQADTPSGYVVELKVPQAPNVFGALATPELKNASVTLPAGLALSPPAASGPNALEGCGEARIDLLGTEVGEGHPGGNGSPYDDGMTHASPGRCPAGSQIGTVEVKTPLLEEALHGRVYVAQPGCGGGGQPECTEQAAEEGRVFGLYIEMAGSGVILKLRGSVEVGGYGGRNGLAVGQLRARFDNNPQLPFEELKMTFSGGQRAALAGPQTCGTATTTSLLEPWSHEPGPGEAEGTPDATPSSAFEVTGCTSPMGFAPGFTAGTVQTLAGGFTPFTTTLSRSDGEQDLGGVSLTMPPGVAGMLSKVPLCGEPQAQAGTCPEASRIGTATVGAGAGSEPLWISGAVFLTGSYDGAPFGLSIVVPAKAGPFDLGNVVERATITVNPSTAQVTVAAGPLRQSLDGVPFRLKTLNVTIDRAGFIFNPTDCSRLRVAGTVSGDMPDGSAGATVAVSGPFAVTGCENLPFKPSFKAATAARTSRTNGASLDVRIASGAGQANIAKVRVQLPRQLPSRLSTLRRACPAGVFEANPAGCPKESDVGTATAVTPVLAHPLTGPAYLVSHGGTAFPDLEIVLQGEGITLVLDGNTDIKNGITSSTFNAVPDAPIGSFELKLPGGTYSILGANLPAKAKESFCGQRLAMPTTITGQNGAVVKQTTKIAATGCPKKARHRAKGKGGKRKA